MDGGPGPGARAAGAQRAAGRRAGPRRRVRCGSPTGVRCWWATRCRTARHRWRRRTPGHQFGGYVPRLGDGRALLLGEVIDADGRRRDVHLKGSGRTPFARGGDGLAAVGPMLREYLVSEAMHALGVPTTRSLAVVATGSGWCARDDAARRGARPGRGEPPAGGDLPVRRRDRRRRPAAPPGRPRDRPPPPGGRGGRATPTWRCSRRGRGPGVAAWRGGCWSASSTA